ncbi:type II toxin-antitoxin system VapB family antitoxin [Candidatus Poribacteria bacterium]|nr:type II toxin-antitoxin system VapB family antitoxin [Candidatus Poribacteria bacterium]
MTTAIVKKTIYLNQNYINKALKIFDVKTEKEAVNRALEIIVEEDDIISMHKEIKGLGEVEKVFK